MIEDGWSGIQQTSHRPSERCREILPDKQLDARGKGVAGNERWARGCWRRHRWCGPRCRRDRGCPGLASVDDRSDVSVGGALEELSNLIEAPANPAQPRDGLETQQV